jgi:phosphopantothenoylcysteine decarboxylase/phosphopantothenate--cysteine ligase
VGFAAESGDPVARGRQKLAGKSADLIVANDIARPGAGFDSELNAATLISREDEEPIALGPKTDLAARILDRAEQLLAVARTP